MAALSQGQISLPSSLDLVGAEDLPISPKRFSEPFPSAHYTAKSLGLEEHMQFTRWKPLRKAREGLPPWPYSWSLWVRSDRRTFPRPASLRSKQIFPHL